MAFFPCCLCRRLDAIWHFSYLVLNMSVVWSVIMDAKLNGYEKETLTTFDFVVMEFS